MSQQGKFITIFPVKENPDGGKPNVTGFITMDGVEYQFAAWSKTSKAGKLYYSGTIKPKEDIKERY